MLYNWQQPDWPAFRYELAGLTDHLLAFADHAGRVGGLLDEPLPQHRRQPPRLLRRLASPLRRIQGEQASRL